MSEAIRPTRNQQQRMATRRQPFGIDGANARRSTRYDR
jgi:hypothetical protein